MDQLFDLAAASPDYIDLARIAAEGGLAELEVAVRDAQAQFAPGEAPLRVGDSIVALRREEVPTTRLADATPAWAAGLAVNRRIGPIVDRLGRETWIDVFQPVRQLRFVRAPGGTPFLSLPVSQTRVRRRRAAYGAGVALGIAGGSLWFAPSLFSSAPANTYCGLRVSSGQLRFSTDVAVEGDEIVVPATTSIDLEVELESPRSTPSRAGSEFASTRFTPPAGLKFSIGPQLRAITVRGRGRLQVWGATIELAAGSDPAQYRLDLNRLLLPMKPDRSELSVADVASTFFVPTGDAPIIGGGLAIPAAVIAPSDLGEASGTGAMMLELSAGLVAQWWYERRPIAVGGSLILLDETRLAVTAHNVPGTGEKVRPPLANIAKPADVTLVRRDQATVHYFAIADGSEWIASSAAVDVRFPMPVDVAGNHVSCSLPAAQVVTRSTAAGELSVTIAGLTATDGARRAFALTNAVLGATGPRAILLRGVLNGETIEEGDLLIAYNFAGLLPSLPDPYATNLASERSFAVRDGGILVSRYRFGPGTPELGFVLPGGDDLVSPPVGVTAAAYVRGESAAATSHIGDTGPAAGDLFDFELEPKIVLLDVSSNASRFGVALRPPKYEAREEEAVGPLAFWQAQGLDLSIDGRLMVLLTLPAVQWEPVRSVPGPEPFPEEVRFANSGVPTIVDVPSVNLVPINPLAAYKTILDNFAQLSPRPSRARFTLPFGLVAQARLRPPSANGRGARVTEARPSDGSLLGAHQLRLDAVDPSLAEGETPALPGFAAQLPVAIPTTGASPTSVLGNSVTTIFNNYLGAGAPSALVPVSRIDLSGHGESLFSAWANPEDPETGVAKAEFQVLNGRAAHEVVQVKSVLLPYMIPVVRTITLERKGNALFTRQDSGWVAVRDGAYRTSSSSDIVVHPGIVQRATRVTNILETGSVVSAGSMQFVAAYFDCDLIVDGAPAAVPARRQLGYVKLSIPPLDAATYAALIQHAGPMGGTIESAIAIAGGRHRMRLHRVGVGVAGPQFAMAAWGSLVFPGGGDWSVLAAMNGADEPVQIPADRGLPIIRAGAAGVATSSPYRFADPEDLLNETSPVREYGILHSMGTQRAYYPRPRIEPTGPHRFVSTETPLIADPFMLATALGAFPRQADAIPFPSATYGLEARQDGTWRLDSIATFPAGLPRVTVKSAGTVRSDVDYTAATVTYSLDTADAVPWRFRLQNAVKVMAHTAMGDLMSFAADIEAEAGRPTNFVSPKLRVGGPFEIVEDLLTILKDLGVPARPDVRMTNKWSLAVGLNVPFVDASGNDLKIIPGEPLPTIKFANTGIKIEMALAPHGDEAVMELGGSPMFAIKSVPGLYVVAIIKFKLKLSTESGTTYGFLIGVGIAYSFEAGPFELKGVLALTFFAVFGDTVFGYGVGFVAKLSADLRPIIAIEVLLEGKMARLTANQGLADETVFQIAKLVFAIEASVFLVFSISLEIETKKVEVLRGPLLPAAAPDVL